MPTLPAVLTPQLPVEPAPGSVVIASTGHAWQRRSETDEHPWRITPPDVHRWFPATPCGRPLSWPLLLAVSGPVVLVHVPGATAAAEIP
ncbi:hypothetical protein [Prauserella cavernicola]|uniref:Uncharacterized protein n=1 Tax=Prauserella cavernicola TaxID=2800127 RepID=A0A934QRY8_9PSEU|nr:hypothetical protein [Prauserella cavernicola]MBK1785116.1 hypothetical protein [Prauserella cavernicola]